MRHRTPEETKREVNEGIVHEVLSKKYLQFSIDSLNIGEDLAGKKTKISCRLLVTNLEDREITYDIEGDGKGVIDALFNALVAKLVGDCHSLSNLELEEFYISVDEEDLRARRREGRGTDAYVETSLTIDNGCGKLIPFRSRDHSMIAASVEVVCRTVEYFVNSERAVLRLRKLVDDACTRNRGDLCERYTYMMAALVCNTSYEESLREETE